MTISSPCPLCKKPSVFKYRPFCSARCKDIDLGNWFLQKYVIAGAPLEDVKEETSKEENNSDPKNHSSPF